MSTTIKVSEQSIIGDFYWTNLMPSATTALYLITIAILLIKYKRQNDRDYEKSSNISKKHSLKEIPAPMRLPLVGNMYMMRNHQDNPWDGFNAVREQHGDIVSLQMGVHPMILLSKVDYMTEVLLKKGEIFADRPYFSRYDIIFGGDKEHSLALCNWSNVHRVRRKFCKRAVVPSLLSARHLLLGEIVCDKSQLLVTDLQNRVHENPNSAELSKEDILYLTGDIFLKFLCNESYSHDDKSYQKFNWNCDYVFYDINQSQLIDFMPYLAKIGVQRNYLHELKQITDDCRNFIEDKIFQPRYTKHKREFEGRQSRNEPLATVDVGTHDYLDKIIIDQLSNATIMKLDDYKVGFADLLAGHSAVSNILMKLLGHLALDRETQDMLCEEATACNLADCSQIPPLPVANAALLEALRFASSPIVPHIAREDTSIGEYYVPKGSVVLFNYYLINMSAEYWNEPRKFNIKRFLIQNVEATTGKKAYSLSVPKFYNPFSVGLRQCLGFRMVETISMVAASRICEKFIIEADDEDLVNRLLEPKGSVALSPLDKCFKIKLMPRN